MVRKLLCLLILVCPLAALAADAPWGRGKALEIEYKPMKVVYDVHVNTVRELESVLDRASHLSKITGADPFDSSTVLVLHGPEIDFFAIKNSKRYQGLMKRVHSLVVSELVVVKMCRLAAAGRGFEPSEIHGFVELVPMGDAEIVRLQYEEGHAYMR